MAIILAIGNKIFLDADTNTVIARGHPRELLRSGQPKVRAFLTRGQEGLEVKR